MVAFFHVRITGSPQRKVGRKEILLKLVLVHLQFQRSSWLWWLQPIFAPEHHQNADFPLLC